MIWGTVIRFWGSTTKMRLRRSVTSLDRASRLSRMKGDSIQVLFTSCNLDAMPEELITLGSGWNECPVSSQELLATGNHHGAELPFHRTRTCTAGMAWPIVLWQNARVCIVDGLTVQLR